MDPVQAGRCLEGAASRRASRDNPERLHGNFLASHVAGEACGRVSRCRGKNATCDRDVRGLTQPGTSSRLAVSCRGWPVCRLAELPQRGPGRGRVPETPGNPLSSRLAGQLANPRRATPHRMDGPLTMAGWRLEAIPGRVVWGHVPRGCGWVTGFSAGPRSAGHPTCRTHCVQGTPRTGPR